MREYKVGPGYKTDKNVETITEDRLSLIGCIGVWSNQLKRFPLPLLALDGQPNVTSYDKITRVDGLLPSDWEDDYIIRGNWTGQVDIPGKEPYGEGSVYLGNANSPSDTYGVIFKDALPYNGDVELGYVVEHGDQTVLHEKEYDGVVTFLIYADSTALNALGRIHHWE